MDHLPAPENKDQLEAMLEGEFQRQLDDALAALGRNLPEVIHGVRGVSEALGRVAGVRAGPAGAVREGLE